MRAFKLNIMMKKVAAAVKTVTAAFLYVYIILPAFLPIRFP